MVSWVEKIVATGLKATAPRIGMPLLTPPCTPPERLPRVVAPPRPSGKKASLWALPSMSAPRKPLPSSTPLAAGKLNKPRPSSASSLSKTGSPRPAGTPRATKRTTPPTVSPRRRTASIRATIAALAAGSGQRTAEASMAARSRSSTATSA